MDLTKQQIYELSKIFKNVDFNRDNVALLFHTTWCGYCNKLEPEWNLFSNNIKQVKTLKIDCDQHSDIVNLFNVRGYPTIFGINAGKISEYNQGRTSGDMTRWFTNLCNLQSGGSNISKYNQMKINLYKYKITKYQEKLDKLIM